MIKLENKKLYDLIKMKDDLVNDGRAITVEIEARLKKIKACEEKEKKITASVAPDKVLKEEGDALVETFNNALKRLEVIGKAIEDEKLKAIPQELKDEHLALIKECEKLERDRNKIALKVQKVKDRVIPIVQKEVKPHLKEYDDIETAKIKDGSVVITTFNHLEDWKRGFKQKQG